VLRDGAGTQPQRPPCLRAACKVLGGSSSINGLVYIRGQKEDFDQSRQLGNTGWSFDDVLPYFRRVEHWTRGEAERPNCMAIAVRVRHARPISKPFIKSVRDLN
jgi:choline dehydrogenase-like flavoprotein